MESSLNSINSVNCVNGVSSVLHGATSISYGTFKIYHHHHQIPGSYFCTTTTQAPPRPVFNDATSFQQFSLGEQLFISKDFHLQNSTQVLQPAIVRFNEAEIAGSIVASNCKQFLPQHADAFTESFLRGTRRKEGISNLWEKKRCWRLRWLVTDCISANAQVCHHRPRVRCWVISKTFGMNLIMYLQHYRSIVNVLFCGSTFPCSWTLTAGDLRLQEHRDHRWHRGNRSQPPPKRKDGNNYIT